MYTKLSLKKDLEKIKINPKGTLLAHFSYKSIGEVEGGPQTVIDAFVEYMKDGLLVIPTHTWDYVNDKQPHYSIVDTPSNIGIIPELARKRVDGFRSAHPTHSVVAFGKDAKELIEGDEKHDTPCAITSAWGKLLDRDATILLVGVGLNRDTFIHGIEEWIDVPNRLTDKKEILTTTFADGRTVEVPSRRHIGMFSENFPVVEKPLKEKKILLEAKIGDAKVMYHKAKAITDALIPMLKENPGLFDDPK